MPHSRRLHSVHAGSLSAQTRSPQANTNTYTNTCEPCCTDMNAHRQTHTRTQTHVSHTPHRHEHRAKEASALPSCCSMCCTYSQCRGMTFVYHMLYSSGGTSLLQIMLPNGVAMDCGFQVFSSLTQPRAHAHTLTHAHTRRQTRACAASSSPHTQRIDCAFHFRCMPLYETKNSVGSFTLFTREPRTPPSRSCTPVLAREEAVEMPWLSTTLDEWKSY